MSVDKQGVRITWIGLSVNLFLGLIKCVAGWFLGSKALVADGAHSLLDLLTDIAVLFGLHMASKPEDANHHYGHHKYASFAKFGVGGLLFIFSLGLVGSALMGFHSGEMRIEAGFAAVVAVISLILKEGLFWWTRAVAKRLRSDLILANALHHRMDSLSSLGVAIALTGIWLGGPEWAFLDNAVTLVFGAYLVFESFKVLLRAVNDLLDTAPEKEIIEDFREHILPTPGVQAYHDFRVRRNGDVFEADLHLQVDPALTVAEGHKIAGSVKLALKEKHPEVSNVLVHVEPASKEHLKKRGISDTKAKSADDQE